MLHIVQLLFLVSYYYYKTSHLTKLKGITIGGWIGGLFEFISISLNGCTNKYQGNRKCQNKYGTMYITTHCINVFHTNSISKSPPDICLCRFKNNSHGKYRDCDYLNAAIQYI